MFDKTSQCRPNPEDPPSLATVREIRNTTGSNGFCELYHVGGPDGFDFHKIFFEASHELLMGPWKDINGFLFGVGKRNSGFETRILKNEKMELIDELLHLLPQNDNPIRKPTSRYSAYTYGQRLGNVLISDRERQTESWLDRSKACFRFVLAQDSTVCLCTHPNSTRPLSVDLRLHFKLPAVHTVNDHFVHLRHFVTLSQWLMRYIFD